jgi:hypothetical protein
VRQQRGRTIAGRPRRGSARRRFARFLSRLRRRSRRGVLGRIRLGTAGKSPRLRRWVLAAALVGVALVPYPVQGTAGVPAATACRSGCRAGVASMVRWTTPLSGAWNVAPGLAGTVPAAGLAYAAVGGGLAAVGAGLTVTAYSSRTGALEWQDTLTGFPAGAAIVSVRAWPGEVTVGVSYRSAAGDQHGGAVRRTEVVLSGADGAQSGRYPAATFGGAVAASQKYTVVVGATEVTSYDNTTGHVRWRRPTGPVAQAWRTDGNRLYVAESPGGFVDSAPASALHRIDLATDPSCRPPDRGPVFPRHAERRLRRRGAVLLGGRGNRVQRQHRSAAMVGARAVPEGIDHSPRRIYLTEGSNLVGVDPQTGKVKATASAPRSPGRPGCTWSGTARRSGSTRARAAAPGATPSPFSGSRGRPGLPWPHYFVDLSGVGGSADQAGNLVVIAACRRLAPRSPAQPARPRRRRDRHRRRPPAPSPARPLRPLRTPLPPPPPRPRRTPTPARRPAGPAGTREPAQAAAARLIALNL